MHKRHFLATLAGAGAGLSTAGLAQPARDSTGPALLTVTGQVTRTNRGPLDPVLDLMMAKQKLAFDKAYAFDFAQLTQLPPEAIKPTLEYDGKPHLLAGPLLATVLQSCGATGDRLVMRAVDGYAPAISRSEMQRYRFIVATHLDGRPMPLGGLGPLWAIYDADRFPEMTSRPLDQRFSLCPWGLYHIEVQA